MFSYYLKMYKRFFRANAFFLALLTMLLLLSPMMALAAKKADNPGKSKGVVTPPGQYKKQEKPVTPPEKTNNKPVTPPGLLKK